MDLATYLHRVSDPKTIASGEDWKIIDAPVGGGMRSLKVFYDADPDVKRGIERAASRAEYEREIIYTLALTSIQTIVYRHAEPYDEELFSRIHPYARAAVYAEPLAGFQLGEDLDEAKEQRLRALANIVSRAGYFGAGIRDPKNTLWDPSLETIVFVNFSGWETDREATRPPGA